MPTVYKCQQVRYMEDVIEYLAFTTNDDHSPGMSLLVNFDGVQSRTNFESGSRPIYTFHTVIFYKFYALQLMRPDAESPSTARLSRKIMTCVLDHQTNIMQPGEVNGKLNLPHIDDFYGIVWKGTESASSTWICGCLTGQSLIYRTHHAGRILNAAFW